MPPRPVSALLQRPRLIERLQSNVDAPMTMIAADAGYGKTTLAADFLRGYHRKSVWYQLDHTDADPIVFIGYIAEGIKTFVPNFGEMTFAYLAEAGEDVQRYPERAIDLLLNEVLQSVEQPFILVLDDYHHIGRATVVHKLVDRILQYSSDLIHVIITTRDLPPLAIMRRRSQASALVLTREDLLFTDAEVCELFRQALGIDLDAGEIAEYRNRTHGWITALQLVRQIAEQELSAGGERVKPDLHETLQRSEKDVFDYFAEEVFSAESDETQRFLMKLSLLDSLPLEDCSRIFPNLRCSATLPELARKNVFLTVAGDESTEEAYRFHPLFRDFLLRRLRAEIGLAALADERHRIARYFSECGRWEAAMPYLIEAENFDAAARIVAERGSGWLDGGAFVSLGAFTAEIPDQSLEAFPRSLLYKAEVARLQGDGDIAAELLDRAAKLLRESSDAAGEAEALHSIATIARRRGKIADALALLERAERLAAPESETALKCANTRGLCLIVAGNWSDAEQQFRFALESAEKQHNERYIRLITHNLALAPGFRGDFGEALRWFMRIFKRGGGGQLPQEAIGHLNVARLRIYRGEFGEAETHLQAALELARLYNLRPLLGEIFEAYGNFFRDKGDLAHAGEFYERAAKAYEAAEIDIAQRSLDEDRARFHLLRGDIPTALRLLERLIETRRDAGNRVGVFTSRALLLRVRVAAGKFLEVISEAREVLEFFREHGHFYEEAHVLLLLAEALFLAGSEKEALVPLGRALDLSTRFDYDFWLRSEIRRRPELFRAEEIFDRLPLDLRHEVENSRAAETGAAPSKASLAERPLTDLTIKTFGQIDIFRDSASPFPADAWTTRRARDIFCYIATSKNRRAAKDAIIDSFWPEDEISSVEKNFHPTISHIRKALNSRQAFKQNFLLFRDGSYLLNPELTYSIDCEAFERRIADAEIAKSENDATRLRTNLEAAAELYQGEFAPGVYDAWAEDRRRYYAAQYGRVISALAKLSFSERKYSAALKFARQALKIDPYREDMYRLSMKSLSAQGKSAAVKQQFEKMQILLADELGIEPAVETRRVYDELIRHTNTS